MKTKYISSDDDLEQANSGSSSDSEGLSTTEEADSESVEELAEEGQYTEASIIDAIENAPPADVSEVHTRQFPVDDVPLEYLEED